MKIAINGFGRIGRLTFRELLKKDNVEVVAINDLTDIETLAHLLRFDSIHREIDAKIEAAADGIKVNGTLIKVFSEKDPENLPWKDLQVDLVLECTGIFRDEAGLEKHRKAGARKVLLSAPAKGGVKTYVLGVNDKELTADVNIASNASCTTNCLAPMAKVLHDKFKIVKGYMTTVHAYTADQKLQDAPHKDLRRARAAAMSVIPTSTGAAQAVGLVLPDLKGKLDGFAMRVPTPTGSVTDLTVEVKKGTTVDEVNNALREASNAELKGILDYNENPLVSSDIIGNPYSCILDSQLTAVNDNMVKLVGWYDNEAGYSARLADMALKMGNL